MLNNYTGEKKKVLHFTIANTGGGITKFILRLWKHIDKEKFQFDFVTMSKKLDFAERLEKEGCKIYYLSVYAEDDREQFVREVRDILKNGYDIVHLHTSWWRGFLLEQLAREEGVPKVIIHSHNADVHIKETQSREDARRLHFEQRELLCENMATDFLACSEEAATWLYGDKISNDKIVIVPNSIEVDEFKFDDTTRTEYREILGYQKTDFVIGHVGRFAYQKNHKFLLDVFKIVSERNDHAKLLLIGTGELENEIKSVVSQYGLESKVKFLGKRDDVNNLMQAMDLFAFPSRFEGMSIVLLEAQAAGLKCIASDRIPHSVKITNNLDFLPVEECIWAEWISKYEKGYIREDMTQEIEDHGFGINNLIETVVNIYGCLRDRQ